MPLPPLGYASGMKTAPSFKIGLCLTLIGIGLLSSASAQNEMRVRIAEPEVRPAVERIELTGSFVARRAARLSPRISGLVDTITVDAGDAVARGDVIVQLDDRLAELALAQAEAGLRQARAAHDEAVRLRDEALRLSESQVIPSTEIEARQSAVVVTQARLDLAEAERATAAERQARHAIVAPFSGVVAQRLTESGEWVETGAAVAELVAADDLWLDVQAPQRLWPLLGGNPEVNVIVDALGGASFPAAVAARVPVSDPQARTFLLRLTLPDADPNITPGMSARVELRLTADRDALLVPRDALVRYPDGTTTLFVVDQQVSPPRAYQREVSVSRVDGDWAVIEAGLTPGRAVVIRGNEMLRDGDAVRIVERPGSD
jgi:RND family efflux transporter MFP subunit